MAVAVVLGGARIMIAQAAAGAILTVAVADGEAGLLRLVEALIGAGVALVFTRSCSPRSLSPCCAVRRRRRWRIWPTTVWRTRMAPVVRESENAGHLDLLGGSCLPLARTALAMDPPERRRLAPSVRELAGAIADLARAPGDRPTQSQAAVAAGAAVRMVATDVMVFAGAELGQAADAVREGTGELDVPDPPPTSRRPFRSDRRWPRR